MLKVFSLIFLGVGIFVLTQVAVPFISFKVWSVFLPEPLSGLVDPVPESSILGVSIENIGNFPAIISQNNRLSLPYREFRVSVPSIKLDNVKVVVETNSFENNLAHLPGSALPGEKGNTFITGHSSLTQLYRPGNFKAIFANLPEVEKGDEILVSAGGQHFKYKVVETKIVDPKNLLVLNPPDNVGRFLTLMTCVPPGFNTKRLVVLAKLVISE